MDKTYKQFTATVEPLAERKMSFLISTAAVDRDGDTIDPKGWDLKGYIKNPVVLWAHDYSQPPVGKAINIQATKDGLKADVEFLPAGMSPFADMIHDMVKGGFLNATSVGFRGEGEKAKDRDKGYDFKSQELLEFSIVPVPSNPEALALRGVTAEQCQTYAKAMRIWTRSVLGDEAPKLDQAQFDSLADAIAKAMPKHKDEPDKQETAHDWQKMSESMPYSSARMMHDNMMNAHAQAKKAMACMEDCGLNEKAMDQAHKDKLQEAHGAAEMAAMHAASAARTAHEYMLSSKAITYDENEISTDVVDIKTVEPEILWDQIDVPEKDIEVDAAQVAKLLMDSMKETLREMAGAQARAAINRMTGRLD